MFRLTGAAALIAAMTLALGACGSSSDSGSSSGSSKTSGGGTPASGGGKSGGTIRIVSGTAPDFLDPQRGYTTQSAEATWISYLGLYSYKHANGDEGGKLTPAVAQDFPKISNGGKTYTMTMRKGLKFSDGTPVKASDFASTIERALKANWGGKSFYTGNIAGALAFDKGKAKTISGIKTDDATGEITITLTQPYGAFANVLAFPSSGIVPKGTKVTNLSNNPPPGIGPYKIEDVVPNRSFSVTRNPQWKDGIIPDAPAGKADIKVKIISNNQSEAQQVLNDQADVFDWGDELPPSLAAQIAAKAKGRFEKKDTVSTYYFFLNTQTKPFNNLKARQAVNYAVDRRALSRLNGGDFKPTCFFLPEGLTGHPTSPCPYGDPNKAPDLAKAKQLVQESGMAGQKITVWGETRSPRKEFVDYYASVLNKIGFKAKTKIIADAQYFPTIGNLKLNPQTGFTDWNQDFPNPSDFYLLMDGKTIQPTNNQNFSQVNDPKIQKEIAELNKVPADKLDTVADRWAKLDEYLAKQAYIVSFGQQQVPKFFGSKVDFGAAVFSPVYGNDWSTLSLK